MELKKNIENIARKARLSSRFIAGLDTALKNKVLTEMGQALLRQEAFILKENAADIRAAGSSKASKAFIDRLALDPWRVKAMADSLFELTRLNDPLGEVIKSWQTSAGLKIEKVRVPIGVVAIIYESRPNVTADCIGLCFKSGNSVILRGGSESLRSNLAIFKALSSVLKANNICEHCISIIPYTDRRAVDALLKLNDYIDVVIPRGGEGLIRKVVASSTVPVIKHYKGICHVYVDEWADLNMAEKICFNAKVQRPGVCNAMESMLVHFDVAARFLPGMLKKFQEAGVQIRGCPLTYKIAKGGVKKAAEKDFRTEYLDLILSVKVVADIGEAIEHVNTYGSHHSDAIVTDNQENSRRFLREVDSACVYSNASTRFTDGYQFGMGAEIGISTDKLHARGPMALEELTTYKYVVYGSGHVRE